jgi:poly [ADP-ribose] polymerase
VKGRAAVDAHVAGGASKHVVDDGKVVWDVMLNQTNIGNNNNKFYVIQMLQDDVNKSKYYCFTRWARVGLVGQFNLDEFNSIEGAKKAFEAKFWDKTKNRWNEICAGKEFKTVAGKYTLIEIDHGADADADDAARPPAKKSRKGASDDDDDDNATGGGGGGLKRANSSKLPAPVQKLIELIFDLKMMEAQMTELEYDIKKQPLGRLSKATIKAGYTVLKELETAINGGDGDVEALTNRFYTLIPHVFGMKRPPLINSLAAVRAKLAMVEALADIEVAATLLKASKGAGSMIDANYEKLNCHIEPVPRNTSEFATVQEYVDNTFKGKAPKIVDVFALEREGEHSRFADVGARVGNRKLLWHGSRLTNFVGILSQGLRIAPPEAPVSGYRFGKTARARARYFFLVRKLTNDFVRQGRVFRGPGESLGELLPHVRLVAFLHAPRRRRDRHAGRTDRRPVHGETAPEDQFNARAGLVGAIGREDNGAAQAEAPVERQGGRGRPRCQRAARQAGHQDAQDVLLRESVYCIRCRAGQVAIFDSVRAMKKVKKCRDFSMFCFNSFEL